MTVSVSVCFFSISVPDHRPEVVRRPVRRTRRPRGRPGPRPTRRPKEPRHRVRHGPTQPVPEHVHHDLRGPDDRPPTGPTTAKPSRAEPMTVSQLLVWTALPTGPRARPDPVGLPGPPAHGHRSPAGTAFAPLSLFPDFVDWPGSIIAAPAGPITFTVTFDGPPAWSPSRPRRDHQGPGRVQRQRGLEGHLRPDHHPGGAVHLRATTAPRPPMSFPVDQIAGFVELDLREPRSDESDRPDPSSTARPGGRGPTRTGLHRPQPDRSTDLRGALPA